MLLDYVVNLVLLIIVVGLLLLLTYLALQLATWVVELGRLVSTTIEVVLVVLIPLLGAVRHCAVLFRHPSWVAHIFQFWLLPLHLQVVSSCSVVFRGQATDATRLMSHPILLLVPLFILLLWTVFILLLLVCQLHFGFFDDSADVVSILFKFLSPPICTVQLRTDWVASYAKLLQVDFRERRRLVVEVGRFGCCNIQSVQSIRQISVSRLPAHKCGWVLNLV